MGSLSAGGRPAPVLRCRLGWHGHERGRPGLPHAGSVRAAFQSEKVA
jgi:hypothetical protein